MLKRLFPLVSRAWSICLLTHFTNTSYTLPYPSTPPQVQLWLYEWNWTKCKQSSFKRLTCPKVNVETNLFWFIYRRTPPPPVLCNEYLGAREGVIIEWPLNGQFQDRCDVILTSQMAVSNIFSTGDPYLKYPIFVI